MVRDEGREGKDEGLSLASKIVGYYEDELKSDDLYSDEHLTLKFNLLDNLRCI